MSSLASMHLYVEDVNWVQWCRNLEGAIYSQGAGAAHLSGYEGRWGLSGEQQAEGQPKERYVPASGRWGRAASDVTTLKEGKACV